MVSAFKKLEPLQIPPTIKLTHHFNVRVQTSDTSPAARTLSQTTTSSYRWPLWGQVRHPTIMICGGLNINQSATRHTIYWRSIVRNIKLRTPINLIPTAGQFEVCDLTPWGCFLVWDKWWDLLAVTSVRTARGIHQHELRRGYFSIAFRRYLLWLSI